jgi:hypothetical protein
MADQPSPRRRFQFRLRTLMIVVTVLAVVCWVVVDRARLIRERDEALSRASILQRRLRLSEDERNVNEDVIGKAWNRAFTLGQVNEALRSRTPPTTKP